LPKRISSITEDMLHSWSSIDSPPGGTRLWVMNKEAVAAAAAGKRREAVAGGCDTGCCSYERQKATEMRGLSPGDVRLSGTLLRRSSSKRRQASDLYSRCFELESRIGHTTRRQIGDALDQCFSTAGPRPGTRPGINYTGPREVLLGFVILVL